MRRSQGRGVATAKAARVPISRIHSNRHANMQNRKDPSQWLEQQGAARRAQWEPSWSPLWVKSTWRTEYGSGILRPRPATLMVLRLHMVCGQEME